MANQPEGLFTYNDAVIVSPDAPLTCRPGERAVVVGVSRQDERSGADLVEHPQRVVYTIEFEDGSDAEIEERFMLREITLDASSWNSKEDFYRDFLAAVRAPQWHGHNLDALWDSIVTGNLNGIDPPYAIRVRGLETSAPAAQQMIRHFQTLILKAAATGRPVSIELVRQLKS